ncbi:MAG: NADH-quinone oxidoreductase subunit NuoK [candidate division Zixibacteria bacterium]|jgi:NADH:ubiquinone oxidoreductase subunit K|nr:NADH-quinone oxidoreductase subunit NuoK [candidate division Zixibacteria bacterium]
MHHYLYLAAILFAIGLFGVITRRNVIGILMSLELMFNAVNINLVAFNKYMAGEPLAGQLFAIFIVVVAAAEATVGLAIVLLVYRNWRGVETDNFSVMKW